MKAQVVGTPSEAEGITILVGIDPGSAIGIARIEYPMRMVDRASVLLVQRFHGIGRLS